MEMLPINREMIKGSDSALAALLTHSIDYAALFPPRSLSLKEALENYSKRRGGEYSSLLRRFILPIAKLESLGALLAEIKPHTPLDLLLILPIGFHYEAVKGKIDGALERYGVWMAPSALEVKYPKMEKSTDLLRLNELLPTYVEVTETEEIDRIAPSSLGVKIRCGAVKNEELPSSFRVANLIARTVEQSLPIKFTAGLHHPVTHLSPENRGAVYGFINVLGAALMAKEGKVNLHELMSMIDDPYPDHFSFSNGQFRWKDCAIDTPAIEGLRRKFLQGFGSCSFREPLDDLLKLGWLSNASGL